MGFFEHLDELRTRLFRAVIAIFLAFIVAVFITNPVITFMTQSYGDKLLITKPTDSITQFFRVSLMLAAIAASPVVTYQLLMFIFPGLTRKERRWVLSAIPATTVFFLFGVVFTWIALLPAYILFLKGFQSDIFKVLWTADDYIGFVTSVLFWHGVAFETPVVFYVLGRLGLVQPHQMIKYWRHAVVAAAFFALFIAPTVDPLTMLIITAILMGLYGFSILLVYVAGKISPIEQHA